MKKQAGACLSPQQIERKLTEAGVNPTAQRIAIARYVLCEADHPTAEEVKAWADKNFPKMSLATVYNTLGTLVKAGLLKELKLGHSESVIYDDRVTDHYHFLDEATGKLHDLMPGDIEVRPKLKKNFKVLGVEVLLKGKVT
jgi:Fur family transcriptional regulator, iron response regulator